MNKFTSEELDLLYNLVRDQHDDVMRGDLDAVKDEISELHLIMHKILKFQKGAKLWKKHGLEDIFTKPF